MSKKELEIVNIVFEATLEIDGISMILAGLANQLDSAKNDSLTNTALYEAIFAVRRHLERVSTDLKKIE